MRQKEVAMLDQKKWGLPPRDNIRLQSRRRSILGRDAPHH